MFTFMFQFFLIASTLALVVVAILTHRADRREVVVRADRAFLDAQRFIAYRVDIGYYDRRGAKQMKKDFDKKYVELISK